MSLGKRLKVAKRKKSLMQEDAARVLGITFQALSNYERNCRDPDTALMAKIAKPYNVTTDYLLGRPSPEQKIKNAPSDASTFDDKLTQIMRDLSPDVTLQFYDLKGMTNGEKENLSIFL